MSESIAAPHSCQSGAPIPRGEKRRREIALVAEQVFFECGFSDTTMQMIALRAGASKETLYRHFGSKEGLFAEIVETRARSFLDDLDANFERPGSVGDVLRHLALTMLDSLLGADGVSLCRTVIGETPRNPELGRIFYARGPDRVHLRLTEFLGAACDRGELACADPKQAARIFLGSAVASFHLRALTLLDAPPFTKAQAAAHVDEVVEMFLLKYAR